MAYFSVQKRKLSMTAETDGMYSVNINTGDLIDENVRVCTSLIIRYIYLVYSLVIIINLFPYYKYTVQ